MREVKRPVFSFRLNLDNPDHKKAWEILQSVPDGQKSSYLVQVILKDQENNQLEKSIRQAIREELAGVSISGSGESVSKKEEIPSQMLDFLSGHMSNENFTKEQAREYFSGLLSKLEHWK